MRTPSNDWKQSMTINPIRIIVRYSIRFFKYSLFNVYSFSFRTRFLTNLLLWKTVNSMNNRLFFLINHFWMITKLESSRIRNLLLNNLLSRIPMNSPTMTLENPMKTTPNRICIASSLSSMFFNWSCPNSSENVVLSFSLAFCLFWVFLVFYPQNFNTVQFSCFCLSIHQFDWCFYPTRTGYFVK